MSVIDSFEQVRERLAACAPGGEWVTPARHDALGSAKGAYLLVLRMERAVPIGIRTLPARRFAPGLYLYAGSAYGSGGLAARLKRHFDTNKALHWHVDHLTTQATGLAAHAVPDGNECQLADKVLSAGGFEVAVAGFGSSDCRGCRSHLLKAYQD